MSSLSSLRLGRYHRRSCFQSLLAQALQLHGDLFHNFSERQSVTFPHTVTNGTGLAQTLYYGGNVEVFSAADVAAFARRVRAASPAGRSTR